MSTTSEFPTTTEQRLRSGGLTFVAYDNFDTIADYVLGIVGTNRRMTRIQRYVTQDGYSVKSTGPLTVETGLTIATEGEVRKPIDRGSQVNPLGKSLYVHLGRGLGTGFGFAAYQYENATERVAANRYHGKDGSVFNRRENVTMVTVEGEPGYPRVRDCIVIEDWNQHGVGTETTVAFEDNGPNDEVKRMADELLDVVDYGGDKTATYWGTEVVHRACQVLGVTVEQAKEGKRRPTV